MPSIAIRAQQLSKRYQIGARQQGYYTLRDAVAEWGRRIVNKVREQSSLTPGGRNSGYETIWALENVSFEIKWGEVVGIIGRNGAGKSTLLKILSRITEPTEGEAKIYGRVGSLLEVGTGFHPELTGRENVFLNGAILGMRRMEIERKLDEIVAFAEIDKFVDTPVKRYSSGMYLRLAFAVAAHLEPEILIVDEVLSVGDLTFQEKCLGKMRDVAQEGRTVLLVSHNLEAVSVLTKRALVVDQGRIMFNGDTTEALAQYRAMVSSPERTDYVARDAKTGVKKARVVTSEPNQIHRWGEPLSFEFELYFEEKPKSAGFSFQIVDSQMKPIMHPWIFGTGQPWSRAGAVSLRCVVPKARIYKGSYTLTTFLGDAGSRVHWQTLTGICPFEVVMDGFHREIYPWEPGECTFIEDVEWQDK
ncbi:ABC transporter ATP-binding protein [Candidatus Nitrospira bockiana]